MSNLELRGFADNSLINPRNIEDFGFVRDFRNQQNRLATDFSNIILVNEDYEKWYNWMYSGQGRYEAPPLTITTSSNYSYEYFLSLVESRADKNEVELKIFPRKGMDHFFDKANGLTFERLFKEGNLPASSFVNCPYLIVPDDLNLQQAVVTTLTFSLTFQIQQAVFEVAKLIADALDVVGTGVATTILKTVALTAHLITLGIQMTIVVIQIRGIYLPKIRYLKASFDYKLIKYGVESLGYTLDSQILSQLRYIATIPIPQMNPDTSIFQKIFNELGDYFNTGYPTLQDTTPTLWSLIEHYLNFYNLKIFVFNGIVKIERRDYFIQNANVVIKPTFTEGTKEIWEYNNDVTGRKVLKYLSDFSDLQSFDAIPQNVQYGEEISEPITVVNSDLVDMKGLTEIVAPFTLCQTKTELTGLEKILNRLFGAIDGFVNFLGGNSNLQASIQNRLGVILISQQFFSITKKAFISTNGYHLPNYFTFLSASNILQNYHKDLRIENNSKKIVKMRIPFTMDNFHLLEQNNFVLLESGESVEIFDINYKEMHYSATVTLAKNDTSNFNTRTRTLI
jgi:hypothetical protein